MRKIINRFCNIITFSLLIFSAACTSISTKTGVGKTEVALLLPLSGDQAWVGNRLEKAIRKGFEDTGEQNFNITAYDVANEALLNKSLNKVLSRHTKLIIGPLYSKDSRFVANKIKGSDVTVMSFSNDPNLAGQGIFVCGHAPKFQITRLLQYFLTQGYTNYITLMPAGPSFQKINQEIQSLIVQNNATLVRSEFYLHDADASGINNSLRNVSIAIDRLNEDKQNVKKPVVLFIEDPFNSELVLGLIAGAQIDEKAELISDWRINISASHGLYYSFTGSKKMADSSLHYLESIVGSTYPTALEYIAYDLPSVVNKALGQKYNKEQFQRTIMNTPFEGLSGKFKFNGYIATRPYDIVKNNAGTYEVLEIGQ